MRKQTKKKSEGRVKNATPNVVDGIKFRSKLESYTYKKLTEAGYDILPSSTNDLSLSYNLDHQIRFSAENAVPEKIKGFLITVWRQTTERHKYRYFAALQNAGDMKKKYFTQVGASYRIADEIKARVEFKESNLLKDPYPTGCHLIVCRNVLIYFTEEAKDEVFRKFYKSLAKEGILFIGSTEQIMNYKDIGYGRLNSFFYTCD